MTGVVVATYTIVIVMKNPLEKSNWSVAFSGIYYTFGQKKKKKKLDGTNLH